MRNLIILFLIVVSFWACEKDEIDIEKRKVLAEYYKDRVVTEFTYNTDGTLKAHSTPYAYWRYFYNERQILKESFLDTSFSTSNGEYKKREEWATPESAYLAGTDTFNLDENNRLASANFYSNITSTFIYNSKGFISEKRTFISNKPSNYSLNKYTYDENGNMIKDESFRVDQNRAGVLGSVREYEFDNYINPFKGIFIYEIPGLGSNINNITRTKIQVMDNPEFDYDKRIIYGYSKKGLPTSINVDGLIIHYKY